MSNQSFYNNTTSEISIMGIDEYNDQQLRYLLPAIIYSAICILVGAPGNLIVVYVYFFKWRRSTSRMFILFLASLDLVNCLTTVPIEIYIMRYSLMLDIPFLCKLSRFSTYSMNSSSAMILVGIAVDRFKRICRPYQRTFSEKISKYICIAAIIISIALTWPSFFLYGTRSIPLGRVDGNACLVENRFDRTPYPLVYFGFMAISTLFIFALLSVLYYFVGLQIYKHRNFKLKNCTHVQAIVEDKSTVRSTGGRLSKDLGSKQSNDKTNSSAKENALPEVKEEEAPPTNTLAPYQLEIMPEPSQDPGTTCGLLRAPCNTVGDISSDRSFGEFSTRGTDLESKDFILPVEVKRETSPRKAASPKRTRSRKKKRVRYLLVRGASTLNASSRGKCQNCLTVRIGKSTLMLFLITVAYIISFLPFYTIAIIRQSDRNFVAHLSAAGYMAYQLFVRSYLLSSAINPIIYCFCNVQFREYCIDLFTRPWSRDPMRNKGRFGRR